MGRNFVILFEEKEGSTPIVRLLDNFDGINILHQVSNRAWEPFDLHCCGPITMRNYLRCLDLIYGDQAPYMKELNEIYTVTADHPLAPFDKSKSVGFKMRFRPQTTRNWLHHFAKPIFTRRSIDRFRSNEVVVFVTIRQDILRWALSRYHGDGTGKPGHLQFKLAGGKIERPDIPKLHVHLDTFGQMLERCERQVAHKRRLLTRLNESGVSAWPMLYEFFCSDKRAFFAEVLSRLELPSTAEEIDVALEKGTKFQKVHGHDIRQFVVNADEVLKTFGERYVEW